MALLMGKYPINCELMPLERKKLAHAATISLLIPVCFSSYFLPVHSRPQRNKPLKQDPHDFTTNCSKLYKNSWCQSGRLPGTTKKCKQFAENSFLRAPKKRSALPRV
eukprot:1610987-Amphidinium_carterae.1